MAHRNIVFLVHYFKCYVTFVDNTILLTVEWDVIHVSYIDHKSEDSKPAGTTIFAVPQLSRSIYSNVKLSTTSLYFSLPTVSSES